MELTWLNELIGPIALTPFILWYINWQKNQHNDLAEKVDNQPSREYCELQERTVNARLDAGEERFAKIDTSLATLHKGVAEVATSVAVLIDRNEQKDKPAS
jgi:hypothetical protein